MHKLPAIALALLLACAAGCGDRPAPDDTGATAPRPADGAAPPATDGDEGVARRFDCQPDTRVVLFDDGSARATLPGGERHPLAPVAGSDPPVYTGNSLYFTITADGAYLSQQDGARELACSEGG